MKFNLISSQKIHCNSRLQILWKLETVWGLECQSKRRLEVGEQLLRVTLVTPLCPVMAEHAALI